MRKEGKKLTGNENDRGREFGLLKAVFSAF